MLATLRTDGTVLLSPVCHEWRDGGFNIWVERQNVKARHLRHDPRATILVAESADGKTFYAVAWSKIVPISIATNTPGTPIPVRYGQPDGIVITP